MTRCLGSMLYLAISVLFVASNSAIYGVIGFTTKSSAPLSISSRRNGASIREKSRDRNSVDGISAGGAQENRRMGVGHFAWPIRIDPKGMSPDYPLTATRIAITVASCYLTWFAQAQYSNVMASAALTLICSMVFDKRLGQAAFCGSFAGMCSTAVIPTKNLALVLGLITSFLYELIIHYGNSFQGIGGRLGATAFLATSIVAFQTGIKTGLGRYAFVGGSRALKLSVLSWETTLLPMALWHAFGSVATIILREVSDDSAAADPVRASAVVGLAGALLLHDKTTALAVYGGSFVGMSLPSKLMFLSPSARRLTINNVVALLLTFALSGAIGGIVHGATIDW
eukprot:CAMPEP_0201152530 /NCGR_PEP_ID=MMETSP0851-20130426/13180_1 /ASSEMBLY_ACC=CAM_ASM_000631 /TAXON_ID=183588 /ORGANISM="Pseudo-nitzschia fraudulenta, Strain WWA7" /LENGTH=340 /DNA_ID=CAMNT_0047429557 /DNA_START=69 /DNA_END=1088 /DNA_ORIENTATION=+